MKCTKCEATLTKENRHGFEVDSCPAGHGLWLDLIELDKLEDRSYDEDELKGSLVFRSAATNEHCPHCGSGLVRFQYRLHQLHLDYCPSEHGYWLDAAEDARILDLMNQREQQIDRKSDAEEDWHEMIEQFRSRSLVGKMRKHLQRRSFFYKLRRLIPFGSP